MNADAKWSTDFVLRNAALDNEYGPTQMHFKKTYFKKTFIPGKRWSKLWAKIKRKIWGSR